MKRYGLATAIGLVLIVNIFVFSGVVYNRSGDPDSIIVLTEREARLIPGSKDNTGMFLELDWELAGFYQYDIHRPQQSWLDGNKLEELGFDVSFPLNDTKASKFYRRSLPMEAYIVLEYGGKPWELWLKKNLDYQKTLAEKFALENDNTKKEALEKNLKRRKRLPLAKSRLFAIDAGNEPTQLRRKYPVRDRFIIVRGKIELTYYSGSYKHDKNKRKKPYLEGSIRELFSSKLFVPDSERTLLLNLKYRSYLSYYWIPKDYSDAQLKPRYEVELKFGKRYEAWISNIKPLQPEAQS